MTGSKEVAAIVTEQLEALASTPLHADTFSLLNFENMFMSYANNKGADQPAHPRSLISSFVVRCLDSMTSLVSILSIS